MIAVVPIRNTDVPLAANAAVVELMLDEEVKGFENEFVTGL